MRLLVYFLWMVPCLVIGFVIVTSKMKDKYKTLLYWLAILITGFYQIVVAQLSRNEFNKKSHYLDTEIRQKIVDGRVMKSDTIYVIEYFKPKK